MDKIAMNKNGCNSNPKFTLKEIVTSKDQKIDYNLRAYVPSEKASKNTDNDQDISALQMRHRLH